jgi:Uma2 family endonuclease
MNTVLAPETTLGHEAYFALEQAEDARYEYLAGEVFAMAGGSERHALISSNVLIGLGNALRDRPCRVYGSDMKLHVAEFDQFCYPDVMVLCEKGVRQERFVEQPSLIVEVLSPSTEAYDRGMKFEHYRTIAALDHYLLLDQDRPHAELYSRVGGVWQLTEAGGLGGGLDLALLGIRLNLVEVYRQVEFPPPAAAIEAEAKA